MPVLVSTWDFLEAHAEGWRVLAAGDVHKKNTNISSTGGDHKKKHNKNISSTGGSALSAVEEGCTRCEELQCDGTVGFGGSPDEDGETTLDAMIMDGSSLNVGAVGCLRRIKPAIRVARRVLERTKHSLLVGEKATSFAVDQGFQEETLSTEESLQMWRDWKTSGGRPNFRQNSPPSNFSCDHGDQATQEQVVEWGSKNHDTIGMLALDCKGNMAAGTSTNGAKFKVPGRVGDSPIPGAGACDNKVDRDD